MNSIIMCSCCVFNRVELVCTNKIAPLTYRMINSKLASRITTRHNMTRIMCAQPNLVGEKRAGSVTSSMGPLRLDRWYGTNTDDKKSFLSRGRAEQRHFIEGVIKERKERFEVKRNQLKESSNIILQDIKKTKKEMKERMEEVIEKENIYTIPNILTVSRIIMSPYLGYLVVQTDYKMALGLFAYAAITDALDGMIARRFPSQQSKIGSFLDPMADKVLIATLFLTLTYVDLIPVPLTAMIISRDLLLVGAGFVIRYQSLPAPRTFSRYFDATHATAQLQPTFISKVNTLVQLALVASTLAAPVFNYVDHPALHGMWYFTAFSTAVSALSYIVTKNTYRINKKNK